VTRGRIESLCLQSAIWHPEAKDLDARGSLIEVVEICTRNDDARAALVTWGQAALKLNDREQFIGWSDVERAQRLGLVVQNRRTLVLADTRMPNLAPRALGSACRVLPEQWEQKHRYKPVLVETFTDIEQFEGTCYKAGGDLSWERRIYSPG